MYGNTCVHIYYDLVHSNGLLLPRDAADNLLSFWAGFQISFQMVSVRLFSAFEVKLFIIIIVF